MMIDDNDHLVRNNHITRHLVDDVPMARTAAILQSMTDTADKGHTVSDFVVTAFLEAQALDKITARFTRIFNSQTNVDADAITVWEAFKLELTTDIMRSAAYGSSRSTSVVSNVMDDVERQVACRLLNQFVGI